MREYMAQPDGSNKKTPCHSGGVKHVNNKKPVAGFTKGLKNYTMAIEWERELSRILAIASLLATVAVFGILNGRFATFSNFITILRQACILTVLALGATPLLIQAEFDLSIGALAGFSGVLACGFQASGYPLSYAIAVPILVAGCIGFLNGIVVVAFQVPAFVATLGMMFALQGGELLYSGGSLITKIDPSYRFLGQGWLGPIPAPILPTIGLTLAVHVLMSYTKLGRYCYAIGANRQSAMYSGIRVNTYRILSFVFTAVFAAFGGILLTSRLGAATVWAGEPLLLPTYAAVYLGGALAREGRLTALGSVVGAFFIALLKNGITMVGLGWYWESIILGGLLIVLLALSSARGPK